MFRRLLFEDWVSLFPLIALIIAGTVYVAFFYRALRMKPKQIDRFAQLPFETEISRSSDERK